MERLSKYFDTIKEFNQYITNYIIHTDGADINNLLHQGITDNDIINQLIKDGYTDLDNLVKDGHAYQIGNHTNNGWLWKDEADIDYIKATNSNIEIKER